MHTSVRKYKVDPEQMDELIRRVDESFAPRIEAMPGFVAYELLDCGNGIRSRSPPATTARPRSAPSSWRPISSPRSSRESRSSEWRRRSARWA